MFINKLRVIAVAMSEVDEEEIREQMLEAFGGADYPVSSPMDLLPALPQGPATSFESGDFQMTVMDMQSLDTDQEPDFPYETPEELIDDLIDSLKDAGEI